MKNQFDYVLKFIDDDNIILDYKAVKPEIHIYHEDDDEAKQIKNYIVTDRLITEHVMSCMICCNEGLNQCKELPQLKGVYS